jgi:hypothetical protein
LIDEDADGLARQRLDRAHELGDLGRLAEVPREQDHAAHAAPHELAELAEVRPRKARAEGPRRIALEGRRHGSPQGITAGRPHPRENSSFRREAVESRRLPWHTAAR